MCDVSSQNIIKDHFDYVNQFTFIIMRRHNVFSRSPYLPTSPKEIFINFEPLEKKGRKRLAKTLSDGEILEAKVKDEGEPCTQSDGELQKSGMTPTEPLLQFNLSSPSKQLVCYHKFVFFIIFASY